MVQATVRTRSAAAIIALALIASCAPSPAHRSGPSGYDILLKRGDGYYFKSRYAEAAAEYSRAIELEKGRAEGYRFRGYAMLALEDHERARQDFDRALEISPGYAEARLGLGTLLFRQGKYGEAIEELTLVTEADPWNSTARYYLALACEKVGMIRKAVEAYKGYIHCAVPRDDETIRHARERIRVLESSPHR
jgi:tetratricopeptide (TPR) repeat protein